MSVIRKKMEAYGDRLMQLVTEAFAEGIVLTLPEPEGGGVLIDPPEGQHVYSISAPIPYMGLTHLSLKRTERLVVKAVVKGELSAPEEIVLPVRMPLPKNT
jgi:hypothetical protein